MALCAIWQKQRNCLRQRSESFYIQRLHILGSHKQHINSKELAFVRFKACLDQACVDKLAKEDNGVNFLLVRRHLFGRTVDAKGMKTKDSKETVKTFSKMIIEKKDQKNG